MEKKSFDISAFTLHIIAMLCMLLDHLWAQLIPGNLWMNCAGRLAFPIFAFMICEGWYHTRNIKKYLLRLLVFALISEIPFNLMMGGSISYWAHQNVIWTFLIALLAIIAMEKLRKKEMSRAGRIFSCTGISLLAALVGLLSFADYNAAGVLTVLLFYFLRGDRWYQRLGQFLGLYWLNAVVIKGMDLSFYIFGHEFFFPLQGFAVLALIPIWLYRGRQGPHSRAIQYSFYAFYPVHMLIIALINILR